MHVDEQPDKIKLSLKGRKNPCQRGRMTTHGERQLMHVEEQTGRTNT
jgi:hypothetical protein